MLTIAQKKEAVAELRDQFARATGIFVAEYSGLDVEAVNQLRRTLRAEGAGEYEYRVHKNTLMRRAAEGSEVESIVEYFTGPTALATSVDPVAAAKVAVEFAKTNDKLEIVGGSMGTQVLDEAGIKALASMPSLDELRGKLVGLLNAPATKIAQLSTAPAAKLARVVGAYAAKEAA